MLDLLKVFPAVLVFITTNALDDTSFKKAKLVLGDELDGLDGLHFHTLCEQNADALDDARSQALTLINILNWINGNHNEQRIVA